MGAVSGGSWFQAQLSYSKNFYESVVGEGEYVNKSIQQVVTDWGVSYKNEMEYMVNQSIINDWTYSFGDVGLLCIADTISFENHTLADFWSKVVNKFQVDSYWPASNWYYYVSGILASGGLADNQNLLWNSTRHGFPNATLVIGLTLPPDVWDFSGAQTAQLENTPVDFIPLAFVAPPDSNAGEWIFH